MTPQIASSANLSMSLPTLAFFDEARWALNIYPSLDEARLRLNEYAQRLIDCRPDDPRTEISRNVYLLACAISDLVDDAINGPGYDFSKVTGVAPFLSPATRAVERVLLWRVKLRSKVSRSLAAWRDEWEIAVVEYIRAALLSETRDETDVKITSQRLLSLCRSLHLPGAPRVKAPAAYRSQDFTHFDALTLAERFAELHPQRCRPVLVIGCRTAGSYLGPVIRAALTLRGFETVQSITIRPKNKMSTREKASLSESAATGGLVLVVDEPVNTGSTLIKAIQAVLDKGVKKSNLTLLLPEHASRKDWAVSGDSAALSSVEIIRLGAEDWYKARTLTPDWVGESLNLLAPATFAYVESVEIDEELSRLLEFTSDLKFHSRLKRAYQVRYQDPKGNRLSCRILAKSVGWGWYSYHALLAGKKLEGLVPTTYGLRDGILLMQWVERTASAGEHFEHAQGIATAAGHYIAARVRHLSLTADPVRDLARSSTHKGMDELAGILCKAYGSKGASLLRRPSMIQQLTNVPCPSPTLIDGCMGSSDWISGSSLVKSDFEHHGLGKTELCVTDPAYDIADTIVQWQLSASEERDLIGVYMRESGDASVEKRLFLYKLLAGTWNMARALDNLADPRLQARHHSFSQRYINAQRFLVKQTTLLCGQWSMPVAIPASGSPVVFIDIDGVIDKQIFGFPATTVAGIQALRMLNRHGFRTVINSARCMEEAKVYAEAYGCIGAVAEYGGVVWHRASGRQINITQQDAAAEIETVRKALRGMPGVFIDDAFTEIVRAVVYNREVTVPVPTPIMQGVLSRARLSTVRLHQTFTDSAVVPLDVDKGKGLRAFLELADLSTVETVAIGDSEPDLAMFRVADRSFAPSHISCRGAARLMGTSIASSSYQRGFLESVQRLIHPDGVQCDKCADGESPIPVNDLFVSMLQICDENKWRSLLRSAIDPTCLAAFRR